MKVKELIEQLNGLDPEETIAVGYWLADDFMAYHDIPVEHKQYVEDALESLDNFDFTIIDDWIYGAYEAAVECNQETPPVYDLGWEESPK